MPTPTLITDLSTTAASNYPAGTDSPTVLDDVQRAHGAFIAQLRDGTGFTAGVIAAPGANSDITSMSALTSINGGQLAGLRNRIINGSMLASQRATSATVTAGTAVPTASTGYPCVDRFFVYSTGANVTAAQVNGSDTTSKRLQVMGAGSVTAVGVGQRIESFNSYDMAGSTCTLSVDLANSLLTTVTWSAYYANTANTFGTIGTPTKTLISTGTFTVSATVARYSAQIAVPAAAVTGVEIVLTVGAQTSGTFTVGKMQLEVGSTATTFEQRPYGMELALCQRYLPIASSGDVALGVTTGTTGGTVLYRFGVEPRVPPTGVSTSGGANLTTGTVVSALTLVTFTSSGSTMARLAATGTGSPYTANQPLILVDSGSLKIIFTGCEL